MFINKIIKVIVIITICLLIFINPTSAEQLNLLVGEWVGTLSLSDKDVKIEVSFENEEKVKGNINIPSKDINNHPLEIKEINNSKIIFETSDNSINMIFTGDYSSNLIEGTLSQNGSKDYNFILKRNHQNSKQVKLKGSEQKIEIPVKGGKLAASLTYPKVHDIKDPLAIIIPGSGPTDRNGNTPLIDYQINNLKNISYFMANNDIISIRYDKRGVGESSNLVNNKTPTFTQYRNDILKIIEYVKNNLGRKPQQIFLVGHSEGSTLAIMTAQEVENLGGLVLISGPGFKQEVLLKRQLQRQNDILYNQGKIEERNLLVEVLDELIKAIENNEKFDIDEYNIPKNYKRVYKSLNNQRAFSKEWLKISPAEILKEIDIPTCIVQGSDDQQIGKANAKRLSSVVPEDNLSFNYIEGVNHLLLDENNKINGEVLKSITEFIKKES